MAEHKDIKKTHHFAIISQISFILLHLFFIHLIHVWRRKGIAWKKRSCASCNLVIDKLLHPII
jgi:hypothetical protein